MNRGNRSTANSEIEVKALAGVKFPPSKVNMPNEMTVTTTGMLFRMKPFNCQMRETLENNKLITKLDAYIIQMTTRSNYQQATAHNSLVACKNTAIIR